MKHLNFRKPFLIVNLLKHLCRKLIFYLLEIHPDIPELSQTRELFFSLGLTKISMGFHRNRSSSFPWDYIQAFYFGVYETILIAQSKLNPTTALPYLGTLLPILLSYILILLSVIPLYAHSLRKRDKFLLNAAKNTCIYANMV